MADGPVVWAVVVAAGRGARFGGAKQFAILGGRPVVAWSLDVARQACHGVVLVVPPDAVAGCRGWADGVVAGGATRAGSVRAGLAAVPAEAEVIVVHDGARPFSSPETWRQAIAAVVAGADGAVPCVPVADTVKQVGRGGDLVTLDRSGLLAAQTPQAFKATALREAHASQPEATDDAGLVEAVGGHVVAVAGEVPNLKITGPLDLSLAESVLALGAAPGRAGTGPGALRAGGGASS